MDYKRLCPVVLEDEPLSKHTTIAIGGPAEYFALPALEKELTALLAACPDARIIGNGSNLLCPDAGLRGMVISTVNMRALTRLDETHILAECGALLPAAAAFAWKLGLAGLEFATGIPGTVGGGLVMNAGAYGGEMSGVVTESRFLRDGAQATQHEHAFRYRGSVYADDPGKTVLSAVFALTPDDPAEIRARMDDLSLRRREKQPTEWPSAGSAFKRPKDGFAAEIIEKCGLKGFRIGGAAISEKHAGFIINLGGASCDDVLRLLEHTASVVYKATGVELQPEIKTLVN
ncbi:MAG: UDP-N-acetylmuramate dehydrogenase [Oscillospiraceae bacterium]|jgi:UDP-N-acetylmuramate dehydrogenase|nr:UDP-N-acetylmuramate dehydrogenase [Oscillospiraceae bacterium]